MEKHTNLTSALFILRHLCRPCHNREKARGLGKYICQKCHAIIEEQPLIFKNDPYHPDHFNCNNCGSVLLLQLIVHYWKLHTHSITDASKPVILSWWTFPRFTGRNWQRKPENWRESSTAYPAMTRWVYQSVVPVGDPLRGVLLMLWANSGMLRFVSKDKNIFQDTRYSIIPQYWQRNLLYFLHHTLIFHVIWNFFVIWYFVLEKSKDVAFKCAYKSNWFRLVFHLNVP